MRVEYAGLSKEFDAIFARVKARITFAADPVYQRPGELNRNEGEAVPPSTQPAIGGNETHVQWWRVGTGRSMAEQVASVFTIKATQVLQYA